MATDISKALAPDAPIVTNENGGKQSDTPYGFHLLPISSMFAVAELAATGAKKYGETFDKRNYTKIPAVDHANHAIQHLYAFLAGDKTDDHAVHAALRCLFVIDTKLKEEAENEEIVKAQASIYEALQKIGAACSKMNEKETATTAHNCSCTHCTCHKALATPEEVALKYDKRKNIAYDIWEALETYRYCMAADPDYETKKWFGMDCAYILLIKDVLDYAGIDMDPHMVACFDLITQSFEEFYDNLDKSIPFNSDELKPMIGTFIDQLVEAFISLYDSEKEFNEEEEE